MKIDQTSLLTPAVNDPKGSAGQKAQGAGAAHDFEALLISQMLRGMRESGSHWLGTGDDQSMDAAVGMAEEQLSRALTAGKGFGLNKMVEDSLKPKS